MIRIAVVEDEQIYVEQLQGYLQQYGEENDESVEIKVFSDGDEIIAQYKPLYDIILLDIQMKFVDGMTAAEQIRKMDSDVVLIFITNMAQYAIKGYSVNAFDFILKPVTYFAFSEKLKRAVDQVKRHQKKYITLKVDGGLAKVLLSDILYVESMKHRIIIHTEKDDYGFTGTMKEMEEKLGAENFFRCNNSYLVNLASVRRVDGSDVMIGSHRLTISRPRRKAFMAALTDYMGGIV